MVKEDTEEVVLNRWDKLKQWYEMGSALAKVIKYGIYAFKFLFIAGGTAVVVGEVTDTTPLRDTAVEVGYLGEKAPLTIDQLWVKVMENGEELEVLKLPHQHNYPDPVPLAPHKHADHIHKDHEHPVQKHTHPTEGVEEALKKLLPDNHKALH